MELRGLQKTTLLDFPGHVACTVFTGGCNFRCPFCHNASLLRGAATDDERMSEEYFFDFLRRRRGILDGVCVTGGEPLLQKDILSFLRRIKEAGYLVKLDTNGSFPDKLRAIVEEGLADYVAMDIKNSPDRYAVTAGCDASLFDCIKESVALLKEGKVPYEFRTTVIRGHHTPEAMRGIGQWLGNVPRYFLQQFVDSGDVLTDDVDGFDKAGMQELLDAVLPYVPNAQIRGV